LDIAQGFLVILVTSTGKVMKIIDQRENNSMHLHQFDQSHESAFEGITPCLTIEDFHEGIHNNRNLGIGQSILRKLVLMLEVSAFFKKNVWKRKEVNDNTKDHEDWSKDNGHQELHNVFSFVIFSLIGQ